MQTPGFSRNRVMQTYFVHGKTRGRYISYKTYHSDLSKLEVLPMGFFLDAILVLFQSYFVYIEFTIIVIKL